MGKKFINDLYYGRITPWERQRAKSLASAELNCKIMRERSDFANRLSKEERRQFENLESLCSTQQEQEKLESFRQGLKIGALFMEAICREEDS